MEMNVVIPGIGVRSVSRADPLPHEYRALLERDDRQKFWLDQAIWPRDGFGKVFLARAVLLLGEAMFPDDWTGYEPSVDLTLKLLPMFPNQCARWEQAAAMQYLSGRVEAKAGWPRDHIDQRDWNRASEFRAKSVDAIEPARRRLAAVKERLVTAFLDGDLPYHLLIAETGDFTEELPPKWWFTNLTWARFYCCRMKKEEPITHAVAGGGFRYLFVDGEALKGLMPNDEESASAGGKSEQTKAMVKDAVVSLYGDGPMPMAKQRDFEIITWLRENKGYQAKVRTVVRYLKALGLI